jgi:Mg2+ and Co2+ transporter CorA
VITYHHDTFRSIHNVKQLLRTSPVSCQRGPAFLLHQILDQVVDFYSPVLDDFDDRVDLSMVRGKSTRTTGLADARLKR